MAAPVLAKPKGRELAIAQIEQEPIIEQSFDLESPDTLIEVTEIAANFPPGVEDAAILYANGRGSDAVDLLQMFLLQKPEEDILWLLLFDLYQISHQKDAFEQLALDYAIKREKSPPAWRERTISTPPNGKQAAVVTTTRPASNSGQLFSLKGALDEHMDDRLRLMLESAKSGTMQLDLSGIQSATPQGCRALQSALQDLQRRQVHLQLASGALIGLLQQYIEKKEQLAPEYWLLLMQLYQMQGKMAEFEDTAIDYAMQFEVSPPSWEHPKQPVQIVAQPEAAEKNELQPKPDANTFSLHGVIGSKSISLLNSFKEFSLLRNEITLDMSDVERIEFSSVSILMDALMQLSVKGKQITIVHANMLIYVLLVVMGIDQIVTVVQTHSDATSGRMR